MRTFRKFLQGFVVTVVTTWGTVRLMLDLIGRAQTAQAASNSGDLIESALRWLFSTPWYVAALLAVCAMALLWLPEFVEIAILSQMGQRWPGPGRETPFSVRFAYFVKDWRAYLLLLGIWAAGLVVGSFSLLGAVWLKRHLD